MFGNHRLLKVAWLCFVLAGILLATPAVKAQSSREKSADSYFARGIEWQARGEFDRGIAGFGLASAFDPHFARAYYMRARAHLSNGDVKAALGNFNGALELDPRHVAAYNDRGYAISEIGEDAAALADFNRALELDPRFARAYYNRAFIRIRQRDYKRNFRFKQGDRDDRDVVARLTLRRAACLFRSGAARGEAKSDHCAKR